MDSHFAFLVDMKSFFQMDKEWLVGSHFEKSLTFLSVSIINKIITRGKKFLK